jgi:hypothetical protein
MSAPIEQQGAYGAPQVVDGGYAPVQQQHSVLPETAAAQPVHHGMSEKEAAKLKKELEKEGLWTERECQG